MGVIFAEDKIEHDVRHGSGVWKLVIFMFIALAIAFSFLNINIQPVSTKQDVDDNQIRVDRILRLSEVQAVKQSQNPQQRITQSGQSDDMASEAQVDLIPITTPVDKTDKNAERIFLERILENPQDIDRYQALLQLYENQSRVQDSEQLLLHAINNTNDDSEFKHLLLKLYLSHDQQQKADALISSLDLNTLKSAEFLAFLAMHHQRANQPQKSILLYNKALAIKPQETRWWLGLGLAYETLEKWRDARSAYIKANDGGEKVDALLANVAMKIQGQSKP